MSAKFLNLTIGKKIAVGFGVVLLVTSIAGVYGYNAMTLIKGVNRNFELLIEVNEHISSTKQHSLNYVLSHQDSYIEDFENSVKGALDATNSIDEELITNEPPEHTVIAADAIIKLGETMQGFFSMEKAKSAETNRVLPIKVGLDNKIKDINNNIIDLVLSNNSLSTQQKARELKALQKFSADSIQGNWKLLTAKVESYLTSASDKKFSEIDSLFDVFGNQLLVLSKKLPLTKVKVIVQDIQQDKTDYRSYFTKIVDLSNKQNKLLEKSETIKTEIAKPISFLIKLEQKIVVNLLTSGIGLMRISLIGSIILGILITIVIGRQVTKPLHFSAGLLRKMAEGDFTQDLPEWLLKRTDEFGEQSESLDYLIKKLRKLIVEIIREADNITVSSKELNENANEMKMEAERQAASAEEITGSMSDILANITTKVNSGQSNEMLIESALREIQKGSDAVKRTKEVMLLIDEKNNMVNDITFQTNILALNAAVEAARAGEQGKGFAVVAQEVRKLAANSSVAANKIDEITKEGVDLSQISEEQLEILVAEVGKIADALKLLNSKIAESGRSSDQMHLALNTLNESIQSNAFATKKSAAHADDLKQKANNLKKSVSYFKIK